MITILPYILTRLFIRKRYTLEGDELRHLATARNFYKFWNRSFYDFHPPLYSWFIRYLKSGVMVSFLCSLGLYVVSSKLYDSLLLTPPQKAIALTFLAFNYTLIYYSNRTFRYQLAALLGTLTIYLLVNHCYLAAGFSWGLLGLTCTFAGLRGFFVWALLGFNPITLLTFLPIFGIWFVEKVKVYMDNEYYPSGQEGKIERVRDFTWKQLLSPMYFPWAYSYYGKSELGYDFRNWFKKIAGVFGLYPPLTFLLPFALFFMVKGMINSPLWVTILVICLLYPSLYKRFLPRNSIIAIPLIGFLLAKGIPPIPQNWVFLGQIGALAGFLAFNRKHILTKPKIKGKAVCAYLDSLPKNGVLAEGVIAYYLAYGSHKRVVVLPRDPDEIKAIDQILLSKKEFLLHYAVISEAWKKEKLPYPAIKYIRLHTLLKTIEQNGDTYYVYEI